jgi:hypothetical protein
MPVMWRIMHSCGHEQDHYLIAEYAAGYDRQAAQLARRPCGGCRQQAAALAVSVERVAIAGLTPAMLRGSPKQVAWAETIRAKRLAALHRHDRQAAMSIAAVSDAKWWIDRRSEPDAILLASALSTSAPHCVV